MPEPGHAGHGDEPPEREADVDVLEVVGAGARTMSFLPLPFRRLAGIGTDPLAAQEAPVIERGSPSRTSSGPLAMTSPPCSPAPGPMSRTQSAVRIVSSSCSTTRTRVAEVAQPGQGGDELGVVLLVEPDRGLVEDVQDAHQAGPDLGRQADPLGLAAGQGLAGPVDRQVVEADVDQEPEPGRDLLDDLAGDRGLALGQPARQRLDPGQGVGDRQGRDLPDVPPVDGDREDLRPEPLAATGRAGPADHEPLELGS